MNARHRVLWEMCLAIEKLAYKPEVNMSYHVEVTLHCNAPRCQCELTISAELAAARFGSLRILRPVLPPGWSCGHFDEDKLYCPSHRPPFNPLTGS